MSNNKQQTAVEFYAEEFAEHLQENYGIKITNLTLLKKSKEMEKEQMTKAWKAGDGKHDKVADKLAEQWYEKTYGGGNK
jgi:hypothetical protein